MKNFKFNQKAKLGKLCIFDKFSIIIIPTLLSILFWSIGPTIIDRSVSVSILGNLYQANKPLSVNEINNGLLDIYIKDNYQTNKRLAEQIYLGNIFKNKSNYSLTLKGKNLTKFYKKITKYFNLDNIVGINDY